MPGFLILDPVLLRDENNNILVITSTGQIKVRVHDSSGNEVTSTDLGGGKRGIDVKLETVSLVGPAGDYAELGEDGRLHVTTAPPIAIDGFTTIREILYQAVGGYNYADKTYVIPNTKKLYITKIVVTGEEASSSGGLYYCPNGIMDENAYLIAGMYFCGGMVDRDVDFDFTGDGTAAILARITRRSKGKRWVGIDWHGFVEV